jgi:hypothetical protein
MSGLALALLVGSGGAAAHVLSDIDNGCVAHSARFDVEWLIVSIAMFALAFAVAR